MEIKAKLKKRREAKTSKKKKKQQLFGICMNPDHTQEVKLS